MKQFLLCKNVSLSRHHVRQMCSSVEVIFSQTGKTGTITLNRPKALNSLNLSMIRRIYPTLKNWDDVMKLVIIKAAGEKAFCAGGDVRAVAEAGLKGDSLCRDFFREEYQLNALISTLKVPFVALISGITMGGGVGLSVHGKYRVATEKTVFAMPETALGLFPDVGGSYFLPKLKRHLGVFLALSGFRLNGVDAYHAGIATHFCDHIHLPTLQKDLLKLNDAEPGEVQSLLDKYTSSSDFLKRNAFSLKKYEQAIDKIFSLPTVEEIFTALETEGTSWACDLLQKLKTMSPLSLKVTLLQLHRGSKLDLKDCLKMEYRLSQHFVKPGSDFYEGVRAILVDKCLKPKWKHSSIEEVTAEEVESMFGALPASEELEL